jgi:hypothetical protein
MDDWNNILSDEGGGAATVVEKKSDPKKWMITCLL